MASETLIPVEEYLRMHSDGPEPDYLDGQIVERHLGSKPHSRAQKRLLLFFEALSKSFRLDAYPELTLRISATRYRVADIAVLAANDSDERYPVDPPEIVVEVVSEDDRYVEIHEKLAEYHAFGVKHVWLVDPWTRKLSVYDASGLHDVPAFELPDLGVTLSAADVFA